jgi:hypothetical protein
MPTEAPVAGAVGVVAFAVLLAALALLMLRTARRGGILAPVVVGLALRLGVVGVAHFISIDLGQNGFFFHDDRAYWIEGVRIGHFWGAGEFVNPARTEFSGSSQYGYWVLIATTVLAAGSSMIAAKLVNVLISAATVVVVAAICRDVFGTHAARVGAWVAALNPLLIWWAVPILKEATVAFLVAAAILCALRIGRGAPYALSLGVLIGCLALTRATAALAIGVALLAALVYAAYRRREVIRWSRLMARGSAILAVTVAVLMVLEWKTSSLQGFSATLDTVSAGDPVTETGFLPLDAMLSFLQPYPWYFDVASESWYRALYPGVWILYGLLPVALIGVWRLARRPELFLLVGTTLIIVALSAIAFGEAFRQRSSVEPLLLVLAVGGMTSWRLALLLAAGAIGFAGLVAAATVDSTIVGVGALALAATLALCSRLLPPGGLPDELPPSPMMVAFRSLSPVPEAEVEVGAPEPARVRSTAPVRGGAALRSAPSPPGSPQGGR